MIVLDTHAWFWWIVSPKRLSRSAARAIERADRIGISAMSVFEFVQLVERRRVAVDVPVRGWIQDALARDRVASLPVTSHVALDAAQLGFDGDPTDRIIYATARSEGAQLVTRDERMRRFDPTLTVW